MTTPTFEPLIQLFRGDASRVRRALEIFARVSRQDLEQLDAAFADCDWATVGMLAHKMKAGCQQIGETEAATGLAAIERALSSPRAGDAIAGEFSAVREELEGVMMRVTEYLSRDEVGKQ